MGGTGTLLSSVTDWLKELTELARKLGEGMPELAGLEPLAKEWWWAAGCAWRDDAVVVDEG
jgi:hypothetical protein